METPPGERGFLIDGRGQGNEDGRLLASWAFERRNLLKNCKSKAQHEQFNQPVSDPEHGAGTGSCSSQCRFCTRMIVPFLLPAS
jgi:hypothetical protein